MPNKNRVVLIALLLALSGGSSLPFNASGQTQQATASQRPIELADSLAWKRIASPTVSNDGQWFAHKLTPNEGNSELVLRRISDGKEWRFAVGEAQDVGGGPAFVGSPRSPEIAFSDDSKWFAFTISPTFKEGKRLKKERKPLQNKVAIVNLATEKKVEFEKVKRFSFSGENASWIALHKYGAESATPAMPGSPPASASGASTPAPDKATGSDLILRELSTGNELNVGNVAEFAFTKKGDWLAWTIDASEKSGNGVQARNMNSGAVLPLDSGKALYKGLNWTEKGDGLAAVKGVEDKAYEDKLYSVVAFSGFGNASAGGAPVKVTYDPHRAGGEDKSFPAGLTVSPNRPPSWTEDFSAVLFGIHEVKKKKPGAQKEAPKDDEDNPDLARMKKPDDEPEKPDLVLWHWQDKRLQSQQQVEESRDKNFSYLCIYHVADKKFIRLADEDLRNVGAAPKQKFAIGYDNRDYEPLGNLDGRRYQDIHVVDLKTGARMLAVKKNRWSSGPSPDGTHFLYYEDGHFFTYDMAGNKSYNVTEKVPSVFWDQEDDHNITKPPTNVVGWTKDGVSVLLSDNWDIWNVPVHGGQAVNLTVNGKKDRIRYQNRFRLDPDEKGIDLGSPVYVRAYGDWTKKTGIARIDAGKAGAKMLQWDDAGFGGLMKARKADVLVYTRESYQDAPSYYVADAALANGKKITDANPQQKDFLWSSGSKLIEYTSAKGDKLQGALYLPANYQPGQSYPTIVYIYEKLTQGLNSYTVPTTNGFNKSVYTSNGYAVLMPDIVYKVNDPGMSAVWCVLPALEAAIKTGVVDKNRVGIQGHSWGGYQTSFLVTQTDAFKAAIAGAPLTEMISMYYSIYWNSGGGNMAIFESSQGRFTGSPIDVTDAYVRNSPISHAKNVKTPLVILHNDKDGAVDFTQGIFYYNTLRRLQKPVVMLQYKGENHGLRVPANMKDYTVRMREFFDHHLKGAPAPKWWTEGVPHLKLKEHLEERAPGKPPTIDPLNNNNQ